MNAFLKNLSRSAEKSIWPRRMGLQPLLLLCLFAAPSFCAYSLCSGMVAFEVYGNLKQTVNRRDGTLETLEVQFAVFVRDCDWLIKVIPRDQMFADYFEAGVQEGRSMILEVFESQLKKQRAQGKEVGENVAQGYILPTVVPRCEGFPEIPVLWALFGSACYFENVRTNRIESILIAGQPMAYPMELENLQLATWTLQPHPPHVPKEIVFFNEGFVRLKSPISGQIETRKFPPPYDKGFTNAILQVLSTKTVNNLSIPTEARLCIFGPAESAQTSADLRVRVEYRIMATNILPHCSISSFTPALFPKTLVKDMRFARDSLPIDVVRYEVSGKWLTDAEVRIRKEYAQARNLAKARLGEFESGIKPKSKILIYLIFCLVTAFAVFAMLLIGKRQKPSNRG